MPKKTSVHELADRLGQSLLKQKWRCAVAESCTGGSLSAVITGIAGSSQWFDRGFVTYSNESKIELLGVASSDIADVGAVSETIVRAMADGVIAKSNADISVAISGIAGPGGGDVEKPVGTVWIAWSGGFKTTTAQQYFFEGDRAAIRAQAVCVALEGLIARCSIDLPVLSSERYFFALWPDTLVAEVIYNAVSKAERSPNGTRVTPTHLHMTLVYLGHVTRDFLKRVELMASQIQTASFDMTLTHENFWKKSHVRWLGIDEKAQVLEQLVVHLNRDLIKEGFKPERLPFIPHVTIARHCSSGAVSALMNPLCWPVRSFCLVKSTGTTNGSEYTVIRQWSLDCRSD